MNKLQAHHFRQSQHHSSQITAVLGPTNTGKTHFAVERMLGHSSGMIGLPLRLLAREIYDRILTRKGPGEVALITGEEKIVPRNPSYFVCTVEAMPLDISVAFLAIDEIQLCADPDRGHVFTDRLLHARGREETLFLGAETMRPIIKKMVPEASFETRPRFSHLSWAGPKKISKMPRRSAIIAFSANQVYEIAEHVRRQRGGAAVVLGALSPRTRNAQVELYQSGEVDFLVATDAVGMGLNMDVDHVAFASTRKFDGAVYRTLTAPELAQIAGRAGRHLNDGTFGTTANEPPLDEELIEQIETHRFDPIKLLLWRSNKLNFNSIQSLLKSLDTPSRREGLIRARPADDYRTLADLASNREIANLATGKSAVTTLWDVCQIPDFRKDMHDGHANLVARIFTHLMSHNGVIDEDWIAAQIDRLNKPDGDVDAISTRIAYTRTWTYIANRATWLKKATYWQARTRALEDKLSDALHERLTQRFIDRRTSLLVKRLKDNEAIMASITADGEVLVEGDFVGRLSGFRFVADPRVLSGDALEGKALRAAATKVTVPEITNRVERMCTGADETIDLRQDGTLWWENGQVARLAMGEDALTPEMELLADTLMDAGSREKATNFLNAWLGRHLASTLEPLVKLQKIVKASKGAEAAQLTGMARGIGFQLVEALGFLNRASVAEEIASLDQPARSQLRRHGVRFGEFSIYFPALLKPAPAKLLVILQMVGKGEQKDGINVDPLPPGLTSLPAEKALTHSYYNAAGYRRCGTRAVRIDMLERLAELIRKQKIEQHAPPAKTGTPDQPQTSGEESATTQAEAPKEIEPKALDDDTTETAAVAPEQTETETAEAINAEAPDLTKETPEPVEETAPSQDEGLKNTSEGSKDKPEEIQAAEADESDTAAIETAEAEKPKRNLPRGAFEVIPDMMSLVGCSGDDFGAILKSLGYRKTVTGMDGEREIAYWRSAPPHKRGKKQPLKKGKGPQKQTSDKQRSRTDKKPPRRKDRSPQDKPGDRKKAADPNSPFAILKSLQD